MAKRVAPTAIDLPPVEAHVFRDVVGHFASGVTVITARDQDADYGVTASAFTSLSLEPPMVLACLNTKTRTSGVITRTGVFGVNILDENQGHLALQFATPHPDKFRGVDVRYGELGVPLLADALAQFECRVADQVKGGTHLVFLGDVVRAERRDGGPLTYYRGKFGRFEAELELSVYSQIRENVIARHFDVGAVLDVSALAEGLGVELAPVFHALLKLSNDGLVTRTPDQGFIVRPLDVGTSDASFDARCVIELGVAEHTVGKISAKELFEFRARMEETRRALEAGNSDVGKYLEANRKFHDYHVALARNPVLSECYERIAAHRILARHLHQLQLISEDAYHDHEDLVSAYERTDLDGAKALIVRHAERSKSIGRRAIEMAGGMI